jgi:hypothetical protein
MQMHTMQVAAETLWKTLLKGAKAFSTAYSSLSRLRMASAASKARS